MLLAGLLVTLAAAPQDPPPPALAERVDALIAKTNACEHFVAVYKVWNREGEEGELRFGFRAPDLGLFEMESGKTAMHQYVSGGTIVIRSRSDDGSQTTATIKTLGDQQQLFQSAMDRLEELFPRKSAASRPEARSGLLFRIAVEPDCEGLTINVATGSGELLAWLQDMRRQPEHLTAPEAAAAELVFTPCEKARFAVSAETGFVSKLEKLTPQGAQVRMQLTSLDLAAPVSADLFRPPPAPAAAKDMSAAYETMFSVMLFVQVRSDTYRALARRVDDKLVEWNDETRSKAQKLFRHVDEELVTLANARLVEHMQQGVDSIADALAKKLAEASPQLVRGLKAGAAKDREGMEKQLLQVLEKMLGQNPSGVNCKLRPTLDEDLLALEQPILREIYGDKITKPLLARFDEKVGKQLEAK